MAAEDHQNQNVASPSAVSRSIKKITISGSKDRSDKKSTVGPTDLSTTAENKNNNNNNTTGSPDPHLPRIVGVRCENKPTTQFKVLLSKSSCAAIPQGETWAKPNGENSFQISVPELQNHRPRRTESHPHSEDEAPAAANALSDSFTQQNSLFNKEALQAEAWIKSKLQDLKDGCDTESCPMQDWEEASQTLQRDLKDFENTCVGDALMETLGDPVEELREAVEMLNDTVRERGRSQSHNQAVQELLAKHARLAVRVEECLCSSKGLSLDILEKETDLAVQCEPDRCGLGALQEKEDHQETDCEVMREEVKEMEKQASWLKELCPEKARIFEAKVQTTLEAWNELEKSVMENKSRLQEFMQLQDFFRSYLAMISWTEDTRSCIFSDTALQFRRDGQRPLVAELDVQMERKFKEFDELSVTATTLLDKGHHLTHMVRERMEELRSMLGWISVHWRVQKQQQLYKTNREIPLRDNIYSEATMGSPFRESSPPELEAFQPKLISLCEDTTKAASSAPEQNEENSSEDGYETMNRIGPLTDSPKASIKVSTYLHVKDNNLAVAPVYESITLPRQKSPRDSDSLFSSSTLRSSPAPEPQTTNVTFRPLARSGSSSIFSSLRRMSKKRKRRRDVRRHTIQKIMGVDEQMTGMHQNECKPIAYDTQTWPLKEGRRKRGSQKTSGGAEAVAYMKNPLLKVIDTECSGEYAITPYAISAGPSAGQVKSHCRFLSLGSVLSFDLPKDVSLIPSIQDIITIPPAESKKGGGTDPDPLSQRSTGLSSFRQTPFTPVIKENSAGISPSAALADPSHVDDRCTPAPSPGEDGDLIARIDDVSKTWFSQSGGGDVKSSTAKKDGPSQSSHLNQASNCTLVPHKHKCLSVHTLIRDLNGHQYHRCAQSQREQEESPRLKLNQASHMRVNLKSTMSISVRQDSADSGISTSSSFKVCTDTADPLWPKGVVGRLVSLEVGGVASSNTKENVASSSSASPDPADTDTDPVHLDHHQFEEEEAELEDIWNQTTNHRQSICSDIMYQPNQEDLRVSDQVSKPLCRSPTGTDQAVLYRDLVTASAPNLLMAEFKLPSLVQSCLGHEKSQRDKDCFPALDAGQRKSWAAFPNREPAFKTSVMMNETVSDQLKPPDMGDNPRYVYQYKEEEEEEEVAGEELEESGSYVQSVHVGSDGSFQQEKGGNTQEHVSTGGRCFTLSGKPELQSMEGTLERKHKLQLGGKKAASRGWSSYHAVLHRHTLCFFQDRKDTLRSSAYGLPLNLKGAECSPAPDYTKKPNCFRLRLRDGSEYLFNTSSRFTMKKWIMKIQASTGRKDPASLRSSIHVDQDLPVFLKPSVCFKCQDQASCRCSSQYDVTSTFPRHRPTSKTENTETQKSWNEHSTISSSETGLSSDDKWSWTQSVTHRHPGEDASSSPLSLDPSSEEWLSSKHRSHSFTSATYQKIKPVLPSAAGKGLEKGSNYCVTVVVGDSLTNGSSGISLDAPLQPLHGWQQDTHKYSALGSFASLPRPRNKSVFKKLFWKKDF
uniref:PH domain-containing protein n=2 Tax=Nothobranchius TaxID=28779 RepID=A0A1A8L2H2_9TELE